MYQVLIASCALRNINYFLRNHFLIIFLHLGDNFAYDYLQFIINISINLVAIISIQTAYNSLLS